MSTPEQFREKYAEACRKAFEGFEPELKGCRNPSEVLRILELARQGWYSKEIAEDIGKTPKAVQKVFRRYNFPRLHNIAVPKMTERHDWKHGEKLMKGYLYRRTPSHPNGTKHGNYVAVHRLVMEEKLGRYLLTTEVVDHIDFDITNNHPDNLRVFQSNGEHLRETLTGRPKIMTESGREAIRDSRRKSNPLRKARDTSSSQ